MIKARAHLKITGMVQGVGFRYFVCTHARRHRVCGWVRNTAGGTVEAVFEGEKNFIELLIDLCRRGPVGAEVAGIDTAWEEFKGEFGDFVIKQ